MFLHHIHILHDHDPVKLLHQTQKQLPFEKNWTNEVEQLLADYDLSAEDINEISRNVWKNRVLSKIIPKVFEELMSSCTSMSKTKHLAYQTFGKQGYIANTPAYLASFLLKVRSRSLSCLVNQTSSTSPQQNIKCRLCHLADENQEHVINCFQVNGDSEWLSLNEYLVPHLERVDDLAKLEEIYHRFNAFQDRLDETETGN